MDRSIFHERRAHRRVRRLWVTTLVMGIGCRAASPTPASDIRTGQGDPDARDAAFVNVSVVPMTGDLLLSNQTVVVRGGVITDIGPANRVGVPANAMRIEGRGKFLMPGLADMHTHLRYIDDLLPYLAYGVTTVLNLGQPIDNPIVELRKRIDHGEVLAPTIFSSGIRIDAWNGAETRASNLVSSPEEAAAEVRRQQAAGFQFIKVYTSLTPDEYSAIMTEAKRLGMPVVGHIPYAVGLDNALGAGQRMIAHAEEYLLADPPRAWNPTQRTPVRLDPDSARIPRMVEHTRASGAFVETTMSTYENVAAQWGHPEVRDSLLRLADASYVREEWRQRWRSDPRYIHEPGSLQRNLEYQRTLLRALLRAGVPLLLGTDSPTNPAMFPGRSLHWDMRALTRAGIVPRDILEAATRNADVFIQATLPGFRRFGRVEKGFAADLLLVDANPLENVENVGHLSGVMVRGRWLSRAFLAARLQAAAATAARR